MHLVLFKGNYSLLYHFYLVYSIFIYVDTNACAVNNGGCSHLCLLTPEGPRCACPDSEVLSADGKNCGVPEATLILSQYDRIMRTPADDNLTISDTGINDAWRPYRMDCDVKGGMVYWIDRDPKSGNTAVSMCNPANRNMEILYFCMLKYVQSKKISNDQELIQSDPTPCPQNQKGNN